MLLLRVGGRGVIWECLHMQFQVALEDGIEFGSSEIFLPSRLFVHAKNTKREFIIKNK